MKKLYLLCIFCLLSIVSCTNFTAPDKIDGDEYIHFDVTYNVISDSHVDIYFEDINKEKVKTLVDKDMVYGEYSVRWDGQDDENRLVPSGIYYLIIKINGITIRDQILFIKRSE